MIRSHRIALDLTVEQEIHFRRAAGTARFAYNWALAEWERMYQAGEKPTTAKIKAKWNAVRKAEFPWTYEVTKCASGQAVVNLGKAFDNFFRDRKKPKAQRRFRYPRFKKKGRHDSFALWNDQFEVRALLDRFGPNRGEIRIPNLGWVRLREPLRFDGRILGAAVSRTAGRWFVAIQVEGADPTMAHPTPGSVIGIDVGIASLMSLSQPLPDGRTSIPNPRARKMLLDRVRKLSRRISRQEEMRKKRAAKTSRRQVKRRAVLAKLHARMTNIRQDAIHKATTAVANSFETIVLEDLNVSGMAKNHRLAGSVLDASFFEIRRQFEYKAARKGGYVKVADRFFASSKTCSACGHKLDALLLSVREWTCPLCGVVHDRDLNAAINLELVGRASPEPLADSPPATRGDMAALVAEASADATKLLWLNRELHPCAPSRTK